MQYRQIGTSKLNLSCIGLGGNVFGHFCDRRETQTILDKASFLGINYIDTADVYSDGLSEAYIGQAVRKNRSKWIIATKVGVRTDERPHGKGKRKHILQSVEQSLRRLKSDSIDIYQMHHPDPDTPWEETFSTFGLLTRQGKIRYFGVSNVTPSQLEAAYSTALSLGLLTFISAQMHYNMLKRYVEPEILPLCRKYSVGVVAFSGLARGILTGKYNYSTDFPKNSRATVSQSIRNDLTNEVIQTVQKLCRYTKRYGRTMSQLALSWILSRKEVSTIIVGTRNVTQLVENSQTADWEPTMQNLLEIDQCIGSLEKFDPIPLGSFPLPYIG